MRNFLQELELGVDARVLILEMQELLKEKECEVFEAINFDLKFTTPKGFKRTETQPSNGNTFTIKVITNARK